MCVLVRLDIESSSVCLWVYMYTWSCNKCVGVWGGKLLDVFGHVYVCTRAHMCERMSVCLYVCVFVLLTCVCIFRCV